MKPRVYIETTIVSYLAARPSRDRIVSGRQALTEEWWRTRRPLFEVVASELVAEEAEEGDPEAAKRRLDYLSGIDSLATSDLAVSLAEALVDEGPIPREYDEDALHIALCAVNGVDFLMTWNCRHLANATLRDDVRAVVENRGFRCPVICTPEELMEG